MSCARGHVRQTDQREARAWHQRFRCARCSRRRCSEEMSSPKQPRAATAPPRTTMCSLDANVSRAIIPRRVEMYDHRDRAPPYGLLLAFRGLGPNYGFANAKTTPIPRARYRRQSIPAMPRRTTNVSYLMSQKTIAFESVYEFQFRRQPESDELRKSTVAGRLRFDIQQFSNSEINSSI